jgi:biopolymer transport protein ExbD
MRKKKNNISSSMTDIAFLLLLFFLLLAITSTMLPTPIEISNASWTQTYQEKGIQLFVTEVGEIWYENNITTLSHIPQSEIVSIYADKKTPYNKIAPLIEHLQKNGTQVIHCLVEQKL